MRSWLGPDNMERQADEHVECVHNNCKMWRQLTFHSAERIEDPTASYAPEIPSSPADFYRAQPIRNPRIHVMGMGSVGMFVAHALKGLQNAPPVTLVFHTREKLNVWEESRKMLTCITDGDKQMREGYDAELAILRPRFHGKEIGTNTRSPEQEIPETQSQEPVLTYGESSEPIDSLILCMKSVQVLSALSSVKHRLHKESVVCFLQNGMGTVEAVNREIFPDVATRPHYMVGINSHGMHLADDPFTVVHAGFGTIALGILPNERDRPPAPYAPIPGYQPHSKGVGPFSIAEPAHPANPDPLMPQPTASTFNWTPNHRYLLRTLLRSPVLTATAYSPPDLLQLQLEKLAVNCIINPLTVMLDARNGSILYNYSLTRVMRLLLAEISLVIRSLPELQYIPNVQQRFDPGRLETTVVGVAHRTRDNISSMLADVRAGRQTEIDFINGWIVEKGEALGIKCFMNYMLMHMVQGKNRHIKIEMGEEIPFVEGRRAEDEILIRDGKGEDVPLADVVSGLDDQSQQVKGEL